MKKIVLSALLILFTACATNSYNIPFVNVDETIQLREGMSRQEVLNTMGDPYYVQSGENDIIIWIYDIREIEVLSNSGGDDVIPNKTHETQRDTGPIHRLEVVFNDNKLKRWNRIYEERKKSATPSIVKSNKSSSKAAKEKVSSMTLSPFVQSGNASGMGIALYKNNLGISLNIISEQDPFDNDDEPEVSDSTLTDNTGYDYYSYKYEHASGASIMLMYKNKIQSFTYVLGLGISSLTNNTVTKFQSHSEYAPEKADETGDEDGGGGMYLKLGIGKSFMIKNFQLRPMLHFSAFEEPGLSLTLGVDFNL